MMKRRKFLKTVAAATAGVGLAGTGFVSCRAGEGINVNKHGYNVKMKLSFFPYETQLIHTFTVSSYSRDTTPGMQVQIEYDGLVGHGEAAMPPYLGQSVRTVTDFLNKVDLEQFSDPFRLDDILSYIDSLSDGDAAAKAAIDIALHDLVGQMLGSPWYKIWGLNPDKAPYTSFTIGIDTPDVVKEKTEECAGLYKVLKVKVGLENDKEMIETIRSITDLPIVVDANQGWKDRSQALDEIFWLKENGVRMVEQPMAKERTDDIAWITERSPLPIIADEAIQRLHDIPSIKGAYSGINIKLMKCTGMREAWKMLNYAKAEGMTVMLGCMSGETSCGITAAAQLSPAADFADLDGNLLISNDRFKGMKIVDGKITLCDKPGLGLELRG